MSFLLFNGRWMFFCFLIDIIWQVKSQQICDIIPDRKEANCKGHGHVQVPQDLPSYLEILVLSYNKLQEIKANEFSAYPQLKILDLGYNNISNIDSNSFATNVNLRKLILFNNSLTEMPSSLLEPLQNLVDLDISNNNYESSALGEVFVTLKKLKYLSIGGPLVHRVMRNDFVSIQNITLEKFALKTTSSLEFYDVGAFSFLNTNNLWCDIAVDNNPNVLPLILNDLAGKSFRNLRFRNLFETTYYTDTLDLFSGLAGFSINSLTFFRGKFNENLLRLTLQNLKKSNVQDLLLLSIDFARSSSNSTSVRIEDLKLTNLVLMDITNPDILRFDWTFTWFNNVTNLYIINVNFNFVPCDAWVQMSNVVMLNVSSNRLFNHYIYNPSCHYNNDLPKLEIFDASNNQLNSLQVISKLSARWPKLKYVDLSSNIIGVRVETCTWTPNITSLILSNNKLTVSVFYCLPITLTHLNMANSQLDRLDMNYFNQAKSLRVLILSNNKIKYIPSGWNSPNLQTLALEGNSFGVIDKGSFQDLRQLRNLSAGNNPYHCTCDLYSFITDTVEDGHLHLKDWPDDYFCYHPQYLLDTKVQLYTPGRLECDLRLVVAVAVSSTAVIVIICMLLCWKFDVPWYLKATFHIIQSKYRSRNPNDSKVYSYHAFISYSYSDADWVRKELLSRLENCNPPYKVCIHERDFLPGKWIIDNIIENIENSRKVIFVLSHNFVNSEWCNYELYFAHQRAIGHAFEDVILVVKENVRLENLPKRFAKLKKMLSTKTYLEWPPEQNRQHFFWMQLKSILGKASSNMAGEDTFAVVNEARVSGQESNSEPTPLTMTYSIVNLPDS